ncbi:YrvL family regulatory protein [Gracilibacillus lacisalsi]|uniref:YrvL family regulatory protein n=1 Tax=Gracilibacillus lacisalsi TaxID=393087 RepID=UPI00037C1F4F|nr:YrvL family regulatory protein [Gracilibacillus lacisalsi]
MSEQNNDSFRDMNKREKVITVAAITLLIFLVVGFVIGVFFFGLAGLFELLGVRYHSIWSLLVFVTSFFVLGIFVDLFFKVFYKITVRNMIGKVKIGFLRFGFDFLSNWLVLFTVDEFMKSITLTLKAEIIIALLLAILEIVFDSDKE